MKLKTIFLTLIVYLCTCVSANAQILKENNQIIVAYYGRPHISSLGVLGQYSPTELADVVNSKAAEYKTVLPKTEILPALDIIYGMASSAPGPDGDYIINLSDSDLEPYIQLAEKQGFLVFIDLQLGKNSPLEAAKPVLKYLKNKNVHLAIDPEFEVKDLNVRPGKVIGNITGEDVNQLQQAMQSFMKEESITEEKYLMVHNFTQSMVKGKSQVKDYTGIHLIMNLDGHGPPRLKINIYNGLYTKDVAKRVDGGFKLFFKEDHPMMTPSQALGIESVSGGKIARMPRFINYQ